MGYTKRDKVLFSIILCSFINFCLYAGRVEPELKWKKTDISVCWGDERQLEETITELQVIRENSADIKYRLFGSKERNLVRDLIKKHFSKNITVIHFSGWTHCSSEVKADVIIMGVTDILVQQSIVSIPASLASLTASYEGKSSVGMSDFNNNNWERGEKGTQKLIIKNLNKGTILHEFGHLSGLRHEHPKSIGIDSAHNCFEYTDSNNTLVIEELSNHTTSYTSYDDFSIMNYCYLFNFDKYNKEPSKYNNKVSQFPASYYFKAYKDRMIFRYLLSKSDIHSLRCLYKQNHIHLCQPNYRVDDKSSENEKLTSIYSHYLERVFDRDKSFGNDSIKQAKTIKTPPTKLVTTGTSFQIK